MIALSLENRLVRQLFLITPRIAGMHQNDAVLLFVNTGFLDSWRANYKYKQTYGQIPRHCCTTV